MNIQYKSTSPLAVGGFLLSAIAFLILAGVFIYAATNNFHSKITEYFLPVYMEICVLGVFAIALSVLALLHIGSHPDIEGKKLANLGLIISAAIIVIGAGMNIFI